MGAGLGGGSSNAFVLKGLNSMFDLKISKLNYRNGIFFRSDCPFFIDSIPALCSSRRINGINIHRFSWFLY